MHADLARNDIGRVCDFGSVQVRDQSVCFFPTTLTRPAATLSRSCGRGNLIVQRYSHVMHTVSSVEGRLAADKTNYDLMRATFPAGTVSGAPKIRSMQIIADLEGTTRGQVVGRASSRAGSSAASPHQAGGRRVKDSEPAPEFRGIMSHLHWVG